MNEFFLGMLIGSTGAYIALALAVWSLRLYDRQKG